MKHLLGCTISIYYIYYIFFRNAVKYIYMHMYTFRYSDFYVNLHLPCCVPPSSVEGFFPKRASKKAFHGGDFLGKFMGTGTWRDSWSDRIKVGGAKCILQWSVNQETVNLFPNHIGIFTWRINPGKNCGSIYPWVNS